MFTTHTKKIMIGVLTSALSTGCASTSSNSTCSTIPKEKVYITTAKDGKIIEQHHIYHPDPNLKKAVVILTKKVAALESKMANFGTRVPASTPPQGKCVGCGPNIPVKPKAKKQPKYRDGFYRGYKSIPVFACATKHSILLGTIEQGLKVKLYDCGTYGWCRVEGRKGFVQAWRFERIGD
jgi:hypothetical protein